MKFGGDTAMDWEKKYEAEGKPFASEEVYASQSFVQTMLRFLPAGSAILDAGCGTGGLLWFLGQRGFRTAGVETSPTAVRIARQVTPHADIRPASIDNLPFPNATFDAYVAIGSWEYPEVGPTRAAREAFRVLKPGGFAFIEVPHANLLRVLAYLPLKQLEHLIRHLLGHAPRFDHHVFSVAEVRRGLEALGFRVLKIQPHDLPEPSRHYGLWMDWPLLRGGPHYELNLLGRAVKALGNRISPWTIATGMFIVARKQ